MENKKILNIVIISVVILCIVISAGIFLYSKNSPDYGDGIYYSQQGDGKYIQFLDDNTFSYIYDATKDVLKKEVPKKNNQVEILSKGTWKKSGDKISLLFDESNVTVNFLEKDGYIYREDKIFRGITSDAKLLENKYLYEESENKFTEAWFLSDGTMSYDTTWDGHKNSRWGTYTRTGDILTVRYDDSPQKAYRFLVLENGITEDIYSRTEIK